MASKSTKRLRAKYWTARIIDALVLAVPMIAYLIMALVSNEVIASAKVCVAGSAIIAAALTAWNFLAQKRLRSPLWMLLIGLYYAIGESLMPLMACLAAGTLLDELILRPVIANTREKLNSSKVIDSRLGDDLH